MSLATIAGQLSRAEMKNVMGGIEDMAIEDDLKPICTACTSDSQCGIKVCRSSPSCIELKVCAKPLIC